MRQVRKEPALGAPYTRSIETADLYSFPDRPITPPASTPWRPPAQWGIRVGPAVKRVAKYSFVGWLLYEVGTFVAFLAAAYLIAR